ARGRRRAADRRALRVAGTEGARAAARFRGIANTGRGTALDPGGHQGIGRAGVGEPVAQLGDVAGPDGGAADAAALHVGRAEGVDAGACLGRVAAAGGGAADGAGGDEVVGGAIVPLPIAALGDVARARR